MESAAKGPAGHREMREAIERLASKVAHEINNPIQYVSDGLDFAREAAENLMALLERYRALHETPPGQISAALREAAEDEERREYQYLVENLPGALRDSAAGLVRIAAIVRSMRDLAKEAADGAAEAGSLGRCETPRALP
jgi:two-component system, NtrC family, sensor kinase